jgi:hypothetical protein
MYQRLRDQKPGMLKTSDFAVKGFWPAWACCSGWCPWLQAFCPRIALHR